MPPAEGGSQAANIELARSYQSQCGEYCEHGRGYEARIRKCIRQEKSWLATYADIQLVERPDSAPEVNAVPQQADGGFETVTVTLDSGACRAVGPPRVGSYFPDKPTEASLTGHAVGAPLEVEIGVK